jgi:hypothetical protein
MGRSNRPRLEFSVGEIVRPALTERERDPTRGYVYGRFGLEIDDRIADAVVFALTPPREPCSLTFAGLDGTACTIDSEELRQLLQ